MNILVFYGTRPEYIKVKPIIEYSSDDLSISTCRITQHKHIVPDISPDYTIDLKEECENRLNSVFSSTLKQFEQIPYKDFDYVLVQGDTATVASIAIAAFNCKVSVIHLEAGLRTYDNENPYPEEAYRQMVSRIAAIHLCPTETALRNLQEEKVGGQITVVGNTCLDNLKNIETSYGNKILVTLHRRENLVYMKEYFSVLSDLAGKHTDLEFILPIHPNPDIIKHKDVLKNITVTKPMSHKHLIDVLKDVRFCISDSGGIQEEASFLKKRVIVCRKETERSEGIGSFFELCDSPEKLEDIFNRFVDNFEIDLACPFGDGRSAERIFKFLSRRNNC